MRKYSQLTLCVCILSLSGLLAGCNSPAQSQSTQKLVRKLSGHTWWVEQVTWSPDGKHVAACSSDNTVQVWDSANGSKSIVLKDFQGGVYACAWSPNGAYL